MYVTRLAWCLVVLSRWNITSWSWDESLIVEIKSSMIYDTISKAVILKSKGFGISQKEKYFWCDLDRTRVCFILFYFLQGYYC